MRTLFFLILFGPYTVLLGQLEFPIAYSDSKGGRKAMRMFTGKDFWIRMPQGGLVQLMFTDKTVLIASQELTTEERESLKSLPFLLVEGKIRGEIYVFCIPNVLHSEVRPFEIRRSRGKMPVKFLGLILGYVRRYGRTFYVVNGPSNRPFHLIPKSTYSGEYGWSSEDAHGTDYSHVRIRSSFH